MGGPTEKKKVALDKVAGTHPPDSAVTFFPGFGTPVALGPEKGPGGLARLLAGCCQLDAQAPPQWSRKLLNRLTDYVPRLGDPNPNPDWVVGPS